MFCRRCNSLLHQEKMFDLPKSFIEFYCLKCGERIWIDRSHFIWDVTWN